MEQIHINARPDAGLRFDQMPRVLVLLAAVCFGTTGTAQALGPDAAPVTVGAVRIAIGGALLLLVARAVPRAAAAWPRRDVAIVAVAIAAYQLAFFAAVHRTGVAVGTVVAPGAAPTALAYVLFARGLRSLSPGETATLTLAEPLTATGLGILALGERPGAVAAIGAGLVLAGLLTLAAPAPQRDRLVPAPASA